MKYCLHSRIFSPIYWHKDNSTYQSFLFEIFDDEEGREAKVDKMGIVAVGVYFLRCNIKMRLRMKWSTTCLNYNMKLCVNCEKRLKMMMRSQMNMHWLLLNIWSRKSHTLQTISWVIWSHMIWLSTKRRNSYKMWNFFFGMRLTYIRVVPMGLLVTV